MSAICPKCKKEMPIEDLVEHVCKSGKKSIKSRTIDLTAPSTYPIRKHKCPVCNEEIEFTIAEVKHCSKGHKVSISRRTL